MPTMVNSTPCCWPQDTSSITPTHTPFASPTGATNSLDPSGWLYTLRGIDWGDAYIELNSSVISSLWTGQSIGIPYTGCGYTYCSGSTSSALGAAAVGSQAFLFATSTIFTSGLDSAAPAPTKSTTPGTSSFEVDPITQSSGSVIEPTSSIPKASDAAITNTPSSSITVSAPAHSTISIDDPLNDSATGPPPGTPTEPVESTVVQNTEIKSVTTSPVSTTPNQPAQPQSSDDAPSSPISVSSAQTLESAVLSQEPSSSQQPGSSYSTVQAGGETPSQGSNPAVDSQNPVSATSQDIGALIASAIGIVSTATTPVSESTSGATTAAPQSPSSPPAPIVVGAATVSFDSSSNFVVSSQTLNPGSAITLGSGTSTTVIALSAGLDKTILQVGESLSTFNVVPTVSSAAAGSAASTVDSVAALFSSPVGHSPVIISSSIVAVSMNDAVPIVIGSSTIEPDALSQYAVSGQTLVPGSSITLGSGTSTTIIGLAIGSSGTILHIGGSVSTVDAPVNTASISNAAPIIIGTNTITPDAQSQYIISGQTLLPGSSITLGSGVLTTVVALSTGPSETILQVGSSVSTFSATPSVLGNPALSAAISSLAENPTALSSVLDSLEANPSVTIAPALSSALGLLAANPTSSLAPSAISSILNLVAANSIGASSVTSSNLPIVVGSSTIALDASSLYIVSGQTLAPGLSITIGSGSSTTIIALQTSGLQTLLIVGSSTSTFPQQQAATATTDASTTLLPAFTLGSSLVRPNSASEYIIGSQTLRPGGPAITISGSTVSLASDATKLVIGTESLAIISQTGSDGGNSWSQTRGETTKTSSTSGVIESSQTGSVAVSTSTGQTTSTTNNASQQERRSVLAMSALMLLAFFIL